MYIVIPLGELLNAEYDQEKLEQSFQKFSCQRETDLEDFLKDKAILYENTNFGKTYLILDKEELDKGSFIVMAYFTIAQKSVDISAISNKQKRKMLGSYPGRDNLKSIPAYLIGQLGRSDSYSSQQLSGTDILNECYNAISMAARIVGGNLIILECRECMFSNFYEKHGFKKLYNDLSKDKLYTLYLKVDFKDFWNKSRD
ncbi:MAG: hypothetical protein HFH79_14505 [Lachnospiraceae bacterium]|jgi:hypothetical protein|nr:hypothetical protein [Lachnospiraceae bacterium]